MESRPRRPECSDQGSFWKHEKCLLFPFCSAACKSTSVRGKRHLSKCHQSHRKYSRFILPLRIACPSQGISTCKVQSGQSVSSNFMCILSGAAEINSPTAVRLLQFHAHRSIQKWVWICVPNRPAPGRMKQHNREESPFTWAQEAPMVSFCSLAQGKSVEKNLYL